MTKETRYTLYLSRDAAALSVGADAVADALRQEAARRGVDLTLVRTGSRGMLWLEPLVEVQTPGRAHRLWPGDGGGGSRSFRGRVP